MELKLSKISMPNYNRIFNNRSEFAMRKLQEYFQAVNEAINAIQLDVQNSNNSIYTEDVESFFTFMVSGYSRFADYGSSFQTFKNILPSRNQNVMLNLQVQSFIAQNIQAQRRIVAAPAAETFTSIPAITNNFQTYSEH